MAANFYDRVHNKFKFLFAILSELDKISFLVFKKKKNQNVFTAIILLIAGTHQPKAKSGGATQEAVYLVYGSSLRFRAMHFLKPEARI